MVFYRNSLLTAATPYGDQTVKNAHPLGVKRQSTIYLQSKHPIGRILIILDQVSRTYFRMRDYAYSETKDRYEQLTNEYGDGWLKGGFNEFKIGFDKEVNVWLQKSHEKVLLIIQLNSKISNYHPIFGRLELYFILNKIYRENKLFISRSSTNWLNQPKNLKERKVRFNLPEGKTIVKEGLLDFKIEKDNKLESIEVKNNRKREKERIRKEQDNKENFNSNNYIFRKSRKKREKRKDNKERR